MNKIIQIVKYQITDQRNSLFYYYVVILLLALLMLVTNPNHLQENNSNFNMGVQVTGGGYSNITSASIIFIFIVGLNSFKTAYLFMQANNVSRKIFYIGNFISFVFFAAIMSIIDTILNQIFRGLIAHKPSIEQIYDINTFWIDLPWTFTFLTLSICLGWLITILYYRSNKKMKVVLSVIPVALFILTSYINSITEGTVTKWLGKFFDITLGLSTATPSTAILSFTLGAILVYGLSFLLVRKAPIKI